ncbi:hypothetical protein ABK040_007857 [Willaertia magna]
MKVNYSKRIIEKAVKNIVFGSKQTKSLFKRTISITNYSSKILSNNIQQCNFHTSSTLALHQEYNNNENNNNAKGNVLSYSFTAIALLLSYLLYLPSEDVKNYEKYLKEGNYEKALEMVEKERIFSFDFLKREKNMIEKEAVHCQLLLSTDQTERALQIILPYFERAEQGHIKDVKLISLIYNLYSTCLLKSKTDLNKANEYIDKAIKLDSDSIDNHFMKACILRELNEYQEAVKKFKYVTKKNQNHPFVGMELGLTYLLMGQSQLAFDHFLNASDLDIKRFGLLILSPECFAYNMRAYCYQHRLKNYRKAIEDYNRSIRFVEELLEEYKQFSKALEEKGVNQFLQNSIRERDFCYQQLNVQHYTSPTTSTHQVLGV